MLYAAPDLKPAKFAFEERLSLGYSLPGSVAQVEDSYKAPNSSRTVFLLQDAHTNESGQLNLSKTLDILLSHENGLKYVFTEAAVGDNSLSFLKPYRPLEERKALAHSYIRKGLLHGTEFLQLTSDADFTLWGVEDPSLYVRSLEDYKAVAKERERFGSYLKKIKATLETLKPKFLNPVLSDFDAKAESYAKGELSLTDYLDVLVGVSEAQGVSMAGFSHLTLLKALKEKESKIDFNRANEEQSKAVAAMGAEDRKEIQDLVDSISRSPSKLTGADQKEEKAFFALLEEKLKDRQADYPELFKYFDYLKMAHELQAKNVLAELSSFEEALFDSLMRTEDERMFVRSEKIVRYLNKLFLLTLTPEEFDGYKKLSDGFGMEHLTGFLNKKIMDLKSYYERSLFLEPGYDEVVKRAEDFYALTITRDNHFLDEMTKKMDAESQTKAALVTGGFHTVNLKALLKSKGISFVSITPQVLAETNLKRYEGVLFDQQTGPAQIFSMTPAKSTLMTGHVLSADRGIPVNAGARLALQDLSGGTKSGVRLSAVTQETGVTRAAKGELSKNETGTSRFRVHQYIPIVAGDVADTMRKIAAVSGSSPATIEQSFDGHHFFGGVVTAQIKAANIVYTSEDGPPIGIFEAKSAYDESSARNARTSSLRISNLRTGHAFTRLPTMLPRPFSKPSFEIPEEGVRYLVDGDILALHDLRDESLLFYRITSDALVRLGPSKYALPYVKKNLNTGSRGRVFGVKSIRLSPEGAGLIEATVQLKDGSTEDVLFNIPVSSGARLASYEWVDITFPEKKPQYEEQAVDIRVRSKANDLVYTLNLWAAKISDKAATEGILRDAVQSYSGDVGHLHTYLISKLHTKFLTSREKIAVIGAAGFVGFTEAALLASVYGHDVVGVDLQADNVEKLNSGQLVHFMPGMEELLQDGLSSGRLRFVTSDKLAEAVQGRDILFLAVQTPQSENGTANIDYLVQAVRDIAKLMKPGEKKIIVGKSTAPPSTLEALKQAAAENLIQGAVIEFAWAPEFFREGEERKDALGQGTSGRRVIGAESAGIAERVAGLYTKPASKYNVNEMPLVLTDTKSAMLVKYSSNGYLAMKIAYIMLMGRLAEAMGFDVKQLADDLGTDERILRHFLDAGLGFGGSCFPKDVNAFVRIAEEAGALMLILNDVLDVNDLQWKGFVTGIERHFDPKGMDKKKIVILGASFKPGTDDVREARSIKIAQDLLSKGAVVSIIDPVAIPNLRRELGEANEHVSFHERVEDFYGEAADADAIVLATEWEQFKELNFSLLAKARRDAGRPLPPVFDGRNALDSKRLIGLGYEYSGVGRAKSVLHAPLSGDAVGQYRTFAEYAAIFFLALRVSFVTNLVEISENINANIRDVLKGLGLDSRIGSKYLTPGMGYGGHKLPNAVQQIEGMLREHLPGFLQNFQDGLVPFTIAVRRTNEQAIRMIVDKTRQAAGGDLKGVTVSVLGLTFKARATHSIENSRAIDLIQSLLAEGAIVRASDVVPTAVQTARRKFDDMKRHGDAQGVENVQFFEDAQEALKGSRVQVVTISSELYKDWNSLFFGSNQKTAAETLAVVDASHMYEPAELEQAGIRYFAVGMPAHTAVGARLAGLNDGQKSQLEQAATIFNLSEASRLYLGQMWAQHLEREAGTHSDKDPLKIILDREHPAVGQNFILASTLTDAERKDLLGAYSYSALAADPSNAQAAENVSVIINSLDGGIGESLKRTEYLRARRGAPADAKIDLSAKGIDLALDLKVEGKALSVSIAEAKLMRLLRDNQSKKYSHISLQPLVNWASRSSYEQLFKSTPYHYDLRRGLPQTNAATYEQVLWRNGVDLLPMIEQDDLPGIDATSGDLVLDAKPRTSDVQPGGHGQWGYYFLTEAYKTAPPQDGKPHVRMFLNGDNLNERLDPSIVGMMARKNIPIFKLTTPATDIDKKGGKDGLRVIKRRDESTGYVPDQMEEADAKDAEKVMPGQLNAFYEAGVEGGLGAAGKQPFNTNVFYFNDTALHDIVKELVSVIGEEEYFRVISPTYIKKASKKTSTGRVYNPVDGAIGTAVHNLNSYFLTSTDSRVTDILKKKGLDRLLYFVDVPRSFFTPVKKTYDIYFQTMTDYFTLDTDQWYLKETDPSLTPPEFNLNGAFWDEVQNLIDALGHLRVLKLKELKIDGEVWIKDATLVGVVKIKNESGKKVDLNAEAYSDSLPKTEDGRLLLENVNILIDAEGKMTVTSGARLSDWESQDIFFFGGGRADGMAIPENLRKKVLGGKAAGLVEMVALESSIPEIEVPPGFTIRTDVTRRYFKNGRKIPSGLRENVLANLRLLENITGQKFGDPDNPLFVSARSGAEVSMPGMLETILNLGMNDQTVNGFARRYNDERAAYDSYRQLIEMYGDTVLGVDREKFTKLTSARKAAKGLEDSEDDKLTTDDFKYLVEEFKKVIVDAGKVFPQDPVEQLIGAMVAVFESTNAKKAVDYRKSKGLSDDVVPAVNVQMMVFGNLGERSATGVGFTRDFDSGENKPHADILQKAQGEAVVAGIRHGKMTPEEFKATMPNSSKRLDAIFKKLEAHYREAQDIEFTIENDRLWMLQTRTGKRTAEAELRIAVEMAREGLITKDEAVGRVDRSRIETELKSPRLDKDELSRLKRIATGTGVGLGGASGQVVFSSTKAQAWKSEGKDVALVREETSPKDFHGMVAAKLVLTLKGGKTSHAALVARDRGLVTVVGASEFELDEEANELKLRGRKDVVIREGDWITVDAKTGNVYLGRATTIPSEIDEVEKDNIKVEDASQLYRDYAELLTWSDDINASEGKEVYGNTETIEGVRRAIKLGAKGFGLVRTEHMFFDIKDAAGRVVEDRLVPVQTMLLSKEGSEQRTTILKKLIEMQKKDFKELLRASAGKPMVIRTLDPPVNEFMPDRKRDPMEYENDIKALAGSLGVTKDEVLRLIDGLHEANPMLGTRGIRLAVLNPSILTMQATAMLEAAAELIQEGVKINLEIMIPNVSKVEEFTWAKIRIKAIAQEVFDRYGIPAEKRHFEIGTMIEIPAAALSADELAKEAEFFSVGSNDMTALVLGLGRDEGVQIIPAYIGESLFKHDPTTTMDADVKKILRIMVTKGRSVNPKLPIGVCGELGGDPQSIMDAFVPLDFTYVSASQFRIPMARLAMAQAILKNRKIKAALKKQIVSDLKAADHEAERRLAKAALEHYVLLEEVDKSQELQDDPVAKKKLNGLLRIYKDWDSISLSLAGARLSVTGRQEHDATVLEVGSQTIRARSKGELVDDLKRVLGRNFFFSRQPLYANGSSEDVENFNIKLSNGAAEDFSWLDAEGIAKYLNDHMSGARLADISKWTLADVKRLLNSKNVIKTEQRKDRSAFTLEDTRGGSYPVQYFIEVIKENSQITWISIDRSFSSTLPIGDGVSGYVGSHKTWVGGGGMKQIKIDSRNRKIAEGIYGSLTRRPRKRSTLNSKPAYWLGGTSRAGARLAVDLSNPQALINKYINLPLASTDEQLIREMRRDYDYRSRGAMAPSAKVWFLWGVAWAHMAIEKGKEAGITDRTALIARDTRKVEPELIEALVAGITYAGLNVVYIGESPNAATSYSWATREINPLLSTLVTSSHVVAPADVKIRGSKVSIRNNDEILMSMTTKEIKELSYKVLMDLIQDPQALLKEKAETTGTITAKNIDENSNRANSLIGRVATSGDDHLTLYDLARQFDRGDSAVAVLDRVEKTVGRDSKPFAGLKIVIEGAHTPSGPMAQKVFDDLGAQTVLLHGDVQEIDGEHKADPSVDDNLMDLKGAMRETQSDMGIAFDLDGDRGAIMLTMLTDGTMTLSPDNSMASLIPFLMKEGGYGKSGLKNAFVRDVLSTGAVDTMAQKNGSESYVTDAGYVFLKARAAELKQQGYTIPALGERSGHAWLDVTGEFENPIAVSVLFAAMAQKYKSQHPDSRRPFLDVYRQNTAPYKQSVRFQPPFNPEFLKVLSADTRNNTGWTAESGEKPNQTIIAIGRDVVIRKALEAFKQGASFDSPAGKLAVKEVLFQQPETSPDGFYRYADIRFVDENGIDAGHFVIRASSNDPTFVASYETPVRDGEKTSDAAVSQRFVSVGGIVMDFLEKNQFADILSERVKDSNTKIESNSLKQYREFLPGSGARLAGRNVQKSNTESALSLINAARTEWYLGSTVMTHLDSAIGFISSGKLPDAQEAITLALGEARNVTRLYGGNAEWSISLMERAITLLSAPAENVGARLSKAWLEERAHAVADWLISNPRYSNNSFTVQQLAEDGELKLYGLTGKPIVDRADALKGIFEMAEQRSYLYRPNRSTAIADSRFRVVSASELKSINTTVYNLQTKQGFERWRRLAALIRPSKDLVNQRRFVRVGENTITIAQSQKVGSGTGRFERSKLVRFKLEEGGVLQADSIIRTDKKTYFQASLTVRSNGEYTWSDRQPGGRPGDRLGLVKILGVRWREGKFQILVDQNMLGFDYLHGQSDLVQFVVVPSAKVVINETRDGEGITAQDVVKAVLQSKDVPPAAKDSFRRSSLNSRGARLAASLQDAVDEAIQELEKNAFMNKTLISAINHLENVRAAVGLHPSSEEGYVERQLGQAIAEMQRTGHYGYEIKYLESGYSGWAGEELNLGARLALSSKDEVIRTAERFAAEGKKVVTFSSQGSSEMEFEPEKIELLRAFLSEFGVGIRFVTNTITSDSNVFIFMPTNYADEKMAQTLRTSLDALARSYTQLQGARLSAEEEVSAVAGQLEALARVERVAPVTATQTFVWAGLADGVRSLANSVKNWKTMDAGTRSYTQILFSRYVDEIKQNGAEGLAARLKVAAGLLPSEFFLSESKEAGARLASSIEIAKVVEEKDKILSGSMTVRQVTLRVTATGEEKVVPIVRPVAEHNYAVQTAARDIIKAHPDATLDEIASIVQTALSKREVMTQSGSFINAWVYLALSHPDGSEEHAEALKMLALQAAHKPDTFSGLRKAAVANTADLGLPKGKTSQDLVSLLDSINPPAGGQTQTQAGARLASYDELMFKALREKGEFVGSTPSSNANYKELAAVLAEKARVVLLEQDVTNGSPVSLTASVFSWDGTQFIKELALSELPLGIVMTGNVNAIKYRGLYIARLIADGLKNHLSEKAALDLAIQPIDWNVATHELLGARLSSYTVSKFIDGASESVRLDVTNIVRQVRERAQADGRSSYQVVINGHATQESIPGDRDFGVTLHIITEVQKLFSSRPTATVTVTPALPEHEVRIEAGARLASRIWVANIDLRSRDGASTVQLSLKDSRDNSKSLLFNIKVPAGAQADIPMLEDQLTRIFDRRQPKTLEQAGQTATSVVKLFLDASIHEVRGARLSADSLFGKGYLGPLKVTSESVVPQDVLAHIDEFLASVVMVNKEAFASDKDVKDIRILLDDRTLIAASLSFNRKTGEIVGTKDGKALNIKVSDFKVKKDKSSSSSTIEGSVSVSDVVILLRQAKLARQTTFDGVLTKAETAMRSLILIDPALIGEPGIDPGLDTLAADALEDSKGDPNVRFKVDTSDIKLQSSILNRLTQLEVQGGLKAGSITKLFDLTGFVQETEVHIMSVESDPVKGQRNLVIEKDGIVSFKTDLAKTISRVGEDRLTDDRIVNAYKSSMKNPSMFDSQSYLNVLWGKAETLIRRLYALLPEIKAFDVQVQFRVADMRQRTVGRAA